MRGFGGRPENAVPVGVEYQSVNGMTYGEVTLYRKPIPGAKEYVVFKHDAERNTYKSVETTRAFIWEDFRRTKHPHGAHATVRAVWMFLPEKSQDFFDRLDRPRIEGGRYFLCLAFFLCQIYNGDDSGA